MQPLKKYNYKANKTNCWVQSKVLDELYNLTNDFSNLQKYICLAFDKMKIKAQKIQRR